MPLVLPWLITGLAGAGTIWAVGEALDKTAKYAVAGGVAYGAYRVAKNKGLI